MSVDFFQRIAYRLARNVVLVALLLGLLGAIGQVTIDLRSHINGFNDQITEVFQVSRNSAQRAVHLLDNALAEEVVRGLENHAFLHRIALRDDRDNVLAEFSRPHNNARTSAFTRLLMGEPSTVHRFELIAEGDRLEGYLSFHVDNEAALEPFYNRVLYIVVTGLLSNTALALVLLYIFNRLLTSPLVSIARRIDGIDGQHPNSQSIIPPPGHERDELGFIVESTNAFVHEVSETQKALRESEHQLRVVVDASPNLVFVLNQKNQFVFANARTGEFYGCDEQQLLGSDYIALQASISEQEAERVGNELRRVLQHGERITQDDALLTDHYHVQRILQLIRLPFQFCGETCVLSIAGDITDRVAAEAHVERLAFYDTLTGLPNRNLIHDRLEMDLLRTRRTKLFGALLFVDIDDFKRINDTMGHSVGDQILVCLSEQMKTQMRRTDTLARIGGD
ncbi:MAG: diguanylate cyclase, partial [Natronospirillum sp.]